MKNLYEKRRPLPAASRRSCSFSEKELQRLSYELAADSIVLLKNDGILPLSRGAKVAVFGRSQVDTLIGGAGSGAVRDPKNVKIFIDELIRAGLVPAAELAAFYRDKVGSEEKIDPFAELFSGSGLVNSGMIYEIFGRYTETGAEYQPPADMLKRAADETDTALLILGRSSGGEECDRHVPEDYELTSTEKALVEAVTAAFDKVVLVLNINGVTDTGWIHSTPQIKAVLYIGCPGQEGAAAAADILVGSVTPSGKLCSTFAKAYGDYPTADNFSWNKADHNSIKTYADYGLSAEANGSSGFDRSPVTLYAENIYLGYRYFDTFRKPVSFPFGFGLSYADLAITDAAIRKDGEGIEVSCRVTNNSDRYSGKEVVQCYVSAPSGRLEQPYQQLRAFHKTALLAPGCSEQVVMYIPFRELASYDESSASYILEPGSYVVRVGRASSDTSVAGCFAADGEICCAALANRLSLNPANVGKIDWLTHSGTAEREGAVPSFTVSQSDVTTERPLAARAPETPEMGGAAVTLADVVSGRATMAELTAQMTIEELATLAVGYGPGLPFGGLGSDAPPTLNYADGTPIAASTHPTGTAGYISPAMDRYGIPSFYYKDGPASVGGTAWPTGMLLACSFNVELLYRFGSACGFEAAQMKVDSWLAPALNLHRNPIGGRCFEYFSEDPLLAGACGVAICRGAEENNVITTCPKHFAVNEQETYRRGSTKHSFDAVDSILTERTARELYLKPFEMVVKGSNVANFMSSFNKINGVFAGGNSDLCTAILRGEWGFEGVVVTDWGDMDIVVDGADAVAAGNDVVMPGGPPVAHQILAGYREGRVTREQLEKAAGNLLRVVAASAAYAESNA